MRVTVLTSDSPNHTVSKEKEGQRKGRGQINGKGSRFTNIVSNKITICFCDYKSGEIKNYP